MDLEDIALEGAFKAVLQAMLRGKMEFVASWLAKEVIPQFLSTEAATRYFRL